MLLTITTTQRPATDLAALLREDPDRVRLVGFPFGSGLVCFSQADEARCTAAVMVHSEQRSPALLALALADVFGDALAEARAESGHRGMPLPIEIDVPVLPCAAEPERVRRLFEPLGYHVAVDLVPTDPRDPRHATATVADDGAAAPDDDVREVAVRLTGLVRVPELLAHLCVLLPALDDKVACGTVEPLLDHGDRWLVNHPERDAVLTRFGTRARAREGV